MPTNKEVIALWDELGEVLKLSPEEETATKEVERQEKRARRAARRQKKNSRHRK